MAELMPLPLTFSCFSKIQTAFTFLVLAHPGSPRKKAVKRVCVSVVCLSVNRLAQQVVGGFSGNFGKILNFGVICNVLCALCRIG